MDDNKDFENFYSAKLQPKMERLKKEQGANDKWGYIGITSFIIGVAGLFFGLEMQMGYYGIPAIMGFSTGIYSYIKYIKTYDIFNDDFKESVIKEIIDHICPGIVYKPDDCIPEREYKASSLYRYYYDDYSGEDLLEGVYKNVIFHSSELKTMDENNNQVFGGIFFAARINSGFSGGTYLWSRDFEQLPASIMDEEYRLMPMPNVVKVPISNGSFNNYFSVYTTAPHQVAEILTEERLQLLVNFREQYKINISLSFVAGSCYAAIAQDDDLFEPSDHSVDDKKDIKIYFQTVKSILGIIDAVKLYELI